MVAERRTKKEVPPVQILTIRHGNGATSPAALSRSEPGTAYALEEYPDGSVLCACTGFQVRRSCAHTSAYVAVRESRRFRPLGAIPLNAAGDRELVLEEV